MSLIKSYVDYYKNLSDSSKPGAIPRRLMDGVNVFEHGFATIKL